jgi:hydrogenase maturation protein HypF
VRSPSATVAPLARRRTRVRVQGTVQGVGFRPYVYRLADQHQLSGYVLNDAQGVLLEVEGHAEDVERFLAHLPAEAPPLAVLERVLAEERGLECSSEFEIRDSPRGAVAETPVAVDSATCADCLRELFDSSDRRYRYPFINCTNCGPRFTIVRGVPYDRPFTTMAGFRMCPACRAEYEDPRDRRFHAQPNACPVCGPAVTLLDGAGAAVTSAVADPIGMAGEVLRAGRILAVKGLGGYHLACRADDEQAVARLRARKHREDRPFALMVGDLEAARALVALGTGEEALLASPARPIVLAERQPGAAVAPSVAPRSRELGVMLAYSPLHHLLLAACGVSLVMTSGNVSDEPIVYRDEDRDALLSSIADAALVHDRPIETRTDDSVARVLDAPDGPRTMFIRRSRGYVPGELSLPLSAREPILACGAELKSTFCLARDGRAWVSHHIGDLKNYETLSSFVDGIEHFQRLFSLEPKLLAHDLHPEYLSSKYAAERDGVRLLAVQHHHAHLAACLAEHGRLGPAIGAIFDGTGYGTDGTVWGGELLLGDLDGFTRVGMLLPVRLPGGERAISEPWRMACSWLAAVEGNDGEPIAIPQALSEAVQPDTWVRVSTLIASGLNSPLTTSAGRLCDAVAALCGVRARVNYEGQAAIELEALCDPFERGAYPIELRGDGELVVIDPRETIAAVVRDADAGTSLGLIAARFHNALAACTVDACARSAAAHDCELVVLAGGVFQNRRLLESVVAGLGTAGLEVLFPETLPIGDGGISFGQTAVAAAAGAHQAGGA